MSETVAPGNLNQYRVSFGGDCAADGSVILAAGDMKTCSITNKSTALFFHVLSNEMLPMIGDKGIFNVQVDGASVASNISIFLTNGVQPFDGEATVSPGKHSVGVTAGAGTNLSLYTVLFDKDCGPDGTFVIGQGEQKSCDLFIVPPVSFIVVDITTGGDDLRSDSAATLSIATPNSPNPVQTLTLKSKGPEWSNGQSVDLSFQLSPPMNPMDIGPMTVTLVQGGSFPETPDNWNISDIVVGAASSNSIFGGILPCLVTHFFPSDARLTVSSPNLSLFPIDGSNEPAPVFSMPSGAHECPYNVSISQPDGNQRTIFFTTDGTQPTNSSRRFVDPILVSTGATNIRAVALSNGSQRSSVASGFFSCTSTQPPPPPPVCQPGTHCCGDVVNNRCVPGCTSRPCN